MLCFILSNIMCSTLSSFLREGICVFTFNRNKRFVDTVDVLIENNFGQSLIAYGPATDYIYIYTKLTPFYIIEPNESFTFPHTII